jgi:serine/threonine protein phosphatase PrpC
MAPTLADFRFAPWFDVAVASRVGAGASTRSENQDNFVVIDFDGRACHLHHQQLQTTLIAGWPTGHGRLAVLDGMGGHGHGREAAEALADGLLDMPPCTSLDALTAHLDALHARLQAHFANGAGAAGRPGTTLTLLELRPGGAPLLYHVGDSRLYELDAHRATPLSVDHVPATVAALAGRLGEADWWREVHGRHAPQIAQAFILGNAFADPARLSDPLFALTPANLPCWLAHLPDRRVLPLLPDAAYLLATDGFWSCAQPDAFVARWPALLGDAPTAAAMVERLFALLEQDPPAGMQPDNLTALLLRPLARHADETALPLEADVGAT